jgi:hypothetical protein
VTRIFSGQFVSGQQEVYLLLRRLRITIEDQIFVCGVVGEGFAQLLYNPTTGWHPCHVEVQNALTIVRDDKKAVQHSEAECALLIVTCFSACDL